MRPIWKNVAHLKKCGIFGKMEHICKNAAHSENCHGALGNMSHIWENAVHLQKCGAFGKMWHIWKNAEHLEKCGTFGKMQHFWKNDSTFFNKPYAFHRRCFAMTYA